MNGDRHSAFFRRQLYECEKRERVKGGLEVLECKHGDAPKLRIVEFIIFEYTFWRAGGGSAFHGEASVFTYVKLNNVAKAPIMEKLEFFSSY